MRHQFCRDRVAVDALWVDIDEPHGGGAKRLLTHSIALVAGSNCKAHGHTKVGELGNTPKAAMCLGHACSVNLVGW